MAKEKLKSFGLDKFELFSKLAQPRKEIEHFIGALNCLKAVFEFLRPERRAPFNKQLLRMEKN